MAHRKITFIHSELKATGPFVMAEFAVKLLSRHLMEIDGLTRVEKVELAKTFSERLLGSPEKNYSS